MSRVKLGVIPGLDTLGRGVQFYPAFKTNCLSLHTHDIVELAYIVKGHGMHLLEDQAIPAKPGSLVIIHHHHQAHGFKCGPHGMDIINLYLDTTKYPLPCLPAPLNKTLSKILPLHAPFGKGLRRLVHLQCAEVAPLAHLLMALKKELEEDRPGSAAAAENYLSLILTNCCRQYAAVCGQNIKGNFSGGASSAAARMERLREHLDEYFSEDFTLSRLAALAHVEPHYLCRAFKAHTGKPVFTYLLHRRLEYSLWLLRHNRQSVTSAALASGFGDLPHFSRLFKREIGLTPRDYRRQWIP